MAPSGTTWPSTCCYLVRRHGHVVDLTHGPPAIVSGSARVPGNSPSTSPSIAAGGGRVLFVSVASKLTVEHDEEPDINRDLFVIRLADVRP